jgi:transcriptional regulator with XRE-family HTH domain
VTDDGWARLGEAIRDRRRALGMSQLELAQAAGISEAMLRVIERARRTNVRPVTLGAVARALGWTRDSVDRVLAGGDPVLDEDRDRSVAELKRQVAELQARLDEVERDLRARLDEVERDLRARLDEVERDLGLDAESRARRDRISARAAAAASAAARRAVRSAG